MGNASRVDIISTLQVYQSLLRATRPHIGIVCKQQFSPLPMELFLELRMMPTRGLVALSIG